jgi:putative chitinase
MISTVQLQHIMPHAADRIATFVDPLNDAMREFAIGTARRQAAFLAQIAHESGELRYTSELASGTQYEGREDLGNNVPGDGVKFKGHGLIQITGKANHKACGEALGLDLISSPLLIAEPVGASRSAGWFWKTHGINELADADKFGAITRRINGGFNGLDERISFWLLARTAVGIV